MSFLNDALKHGLRCVRVVHGKGLRSRNAEPVLKRKIGNWLAQRDEVLAFVQARVEDGGSGAVMVLLKAKGTKRGEGRARGKNKTAGRPPWLEYHRTESRCRWHHWVAYNLSYKV